MSESTLLSMRDAIAPGGVLRACINLGNPVLANRTGPEARPSGVSIDVATSLADLLTARVQWCVVGNAAASVQAVREGRADVGFFAVDPARSEGVLFTRPYVLIEGAYLVRADSALRSMDEVDAIGRKIAVGRGSAYDLHLSRALVSATISRVEGAAEVLHALRASEAEVAAGIRPQLEAEAERDSLLRMVPGTFMTIQQAIGMSASRGVAACTALDAFVQRQLLSGFVADALRRHHITGARPA